MALTSEERLRIEERARDPEGVDRREREAEAERTLGRCLWAAVMLSDGLDVVRSVMTSKPVLARQLDPAALRRALRGGRPWPAGEEYITVDADMLDAVAEGGAFIDGEPEASTERARLMLLVDRATQRQPMTLGDADDDEIQAGTDG
jgi:hypothetical protein